MGPYDWQWGPGAVGMPPNYGGGFPGPTPGSFAGNAPPVPASPLSPYRTSPGFAPVQVGPMTGSPLADTQTAFAPTTGGNAGDSPSGFQWSNMLNPLFLGGLGMLTSSFGGRPINAPGPMQGFMMGAGMGRQFQLDQEKRAQAQAEAEVAAAEAQRQAAYQTAVEEQFGPGAGAAAAAGQPLGPFLPTTTKPTDDMREYQMARDQGYEGSFLDYQTMLAREKATRVSQQVSTGDTGTQPLSSELASDLGIPEEDRDSYVINKGKLEVKPGVETPKDIAKLERGKDATLGAIDNYVAAANVKGSEIFGTAAYRNAKAARQAVVAMVAKNVLGTPGAEPNVELYRQAEDLVADYAGPIDSPQFAQRIEALKNQINSGEVGEWTPENQAELERLRREQQ